MNNGILKLGQWDGARDTYLSLSTFPYSSHPFLATFRISSQLPSLHLKFPSFHRNPNLSHFPFANKARVLSMKRAILI